MSNQLYMKAKHTQLIEINCFNHFWQFSCWRGECAIEFLRKSKKEEKEKKTGAVIAQPTLPPQHGCTVSATLLTSVHSWPNPIRKDAVYTSPKHTPITNSHKNIDTILYWKSRGRASWPYPSRVPSSLRPCDPWLHLTSKHIMWVSIY